MDCIYLAIVWFAHGFRVLFDVHNNNKNSTRNIFSVCKEIQNVAESVLVLFS